MPTASSTDAIVEEGEKIGVVSNYLDHPNGTSRHLHFDVQVFTRDGWLWVNPYVTLISAYERLIRGRGREIGPEPAALPAMAAFVSRRDGSHFAADRCLAGVFFDPDSPARRRELIVTTRPHRRPLAAPAGSSDRRRRTCSRH